MIIDYDINKDNWCTIKDILPQITEIKSLKLINRGLTELPEMSHITINEVFDCSHNQITSFKGCPVVNGAFWCNANKITSFKNCQIGNGSLYCYDNQITSFKDCPQHIKGNFHCDRNNFTSFKDCPIVDVNFYSNIWEFSKVYNHSKEKKISYLEAQVELYNIQDKDILEHIDKFPDLVAYIRLKELNKLLCT